MTRKEKIALLIDELGDIRCSNFDADTDEYKTLKEAVRVIKALEQEPCEDCVSRQAALDAMCALCNTRETLKENPWRDNPHIDAIIDALDNLPPITPQPKIGHWIYIGNSDVNGLKICECDCCNKRTYGSHSYCPNCGAKMFEPQESEGTV